MDVGERVQDRCKGFLKGLSSSRTGSHTGRFCPHMVESPNGRIGRSPRRHAAPKRAFEGHYPRSSGHRDTAPGDHESRATRRRHVPGGDGPVTPRTNIASMPRLRPACCTHSVISSRIMNP